MGNWLESYTGKGNSPSIEQRKLETQVQEYFKTITAYAPVYTTFSGGVYEMDLTHACIHSLATHISKANPVIKGKSYKQLEKQLQVKPNSIMTKSQFMYKVATNYFVENNCFIIPLYEDRSAGRIIGLYPVRSSDSKVVEVDGQYILKYKVQMSSGYAKEYAIPYEEVGHLKSHYYSSDLFGDSNNVLSTTMQMMNAQKNSIIGSVENSAIIRFFAKLKEAVKPADLAKQKEVLTRMNLASENTSGIMLVDSSIDQFQQINSAPYFVDPLQNEQIKANAFNHFGTNEPFIQNKCDEETRNSVYEGAIEPFLIQLSEVITSMLFNKKEINAGSEVVFEESRWDRASNKTKLQMQAVVDRGALSPNEWRKILHLPPIKGGDVFYIRGEYINTETISKQPISGEPDDLALEPKEPDDVDEDGKEDEDDIQR